MASSSNIGFVRFPWGKLPRSPVSCKKQEGRNPMEVSFRDIMDEQQRERESSQEKDFDEYIQDSYVNVTTPPGTPLPREVSEVEKSFMQIEDLDQDLKLVMSFYEEQDFDDVTYELTEEDLDALEDDDSAKYYEGLAKKLSTVVEIQNIPSHSNKGNKGSRTKTSGSLQDSQFRLSSNQNCVENAVDTESKVVLDKLKQKGILRGTFKPIHVDSSTTILFASGGMLKRRDETISSVNTSPSSSIILKLRLPKECAIKVFKNSANTKTEPQEEEPKLVNAKREMTYLNRMTRAGIPCPQVQFLHRHILVVEFLGKDGIPARKLKDCHDLTNSRVTMKSAYEQIITNMKNLFKTCHLVHGQLSEDNILWHKRQPYFTNVANAVNSNRENALELLYRDCVSVTEFFEKKGKPDCRTPQALFQSITGFDFSGQHVDCSTEQDYAIV